MNINISTSNINTINNSTITINNNNNYNTNNINDYKIPQFKKPSSVDPKEKRWQLLIKIRNELDDLLSKKIISKRICYLRKNLDKIMDLKDKLKNQEKNLKLAKIISLRERNLYLEKLRQIEDYGEKLDWKDNSGLLGQINDMLYND